MTEAEKQNNFTGEGTIENPYAISVAANIGLTEFIQEVAGHEISKGLEYDDYLVHIQVDAGSFSIAKSIYSKHNQPIFEAKLVKDHSGSHPDGNPGRLVWLSSYASSMFTFEAINRELQTLFNK